MIITAKRLYRRLKRLVISTANSEETRQAAELTGGLVMDMRTLTCAPDYTFVDRLMEKFKVTLAEDVKQWYESSLEWEYRQLGLRQKMSDGDVEGNINAFVNGAKRCIIAAPPYSDLPELLQGTAALKKTMVICPNYRRDAWAGSPAEIVTWRQYNDAVGGKYDGRDVELVILDQAQHALNVKRMESLVTNARNLIIITSPPTVEDLWLYLHWIDNARFSSVGTFETVYSNDIQNLKDVIAPMYFEYEFADKTEQNITISLPEEHREIVKKHPGNPIAINAPELMNYKSFRRKMFFLKDLGDDCKPWGRTIIIFKNNELVQFFAGIAGIPYFHNGLPPYAIEKLMDDDWNLIASTIDCLTIPDYNINALVIAQPLETADKYALDTLFPMARMITLYTEEENQNV